MGYVTLQPRPDIGRIGELRRYLGQLSLAAGSNDNANALALCDGAAHEGDVGSVEE